MKIIVSFMVLMFASFAHAECMFNCILSPGTVCVNGVCVPKATPAPSTVPVPIPTSSKLSEIRLDSKPLVQIVPMTLVCSGYDFQNIKVYLSRKVPPPMASFYSAIIYTNKDLQGKDYTSAFYARKDIMNEFVFILADPGEVPKPQFYGVDFVFNQWQNLSFAAVLKNLSCSKLIEGKAIFLYGISFNPDMSDFEGNAFTFR